MALGVKRLDQTGLPNTNDHYQKRAWTLAFSRVVMGRQWWQWWTWHWPRSCQNLWRWPEGVNTFNFEGNIPCLGMGEIHPFPRPSTSMPYPSHSSSVSLGRQNECWHSVSCGIIIVGLGMEDCRRRGGKCWWLLLALAAAVAVIVVVAEVLAA